MGFLDAIMQKRPRRYQQDRFDGNGRGMVGRRRHRHGARRRDPCPTGERGWPPVRLHLSLLASAAWTGSSIRRSCTAGSSYEIFVFSRATGPACATTSTSATASSPSGGAISAPPSGTAALGSTYRFTHYLLILPFPGFPHSSTRASRGRPPLPAMPGREEPEPAAAGTSSEVTRQRTARAEIGPGRATRRAFHERRFYHEQEKRSGKRTGRERPGSHERPP